MRFGVLNMKCLLVVFDSHGVHISHLITLPGHILRLPTFLSRFEFEVYETSSKFLQSGIQLSNLEDILTLISYLNL